MTTYRDVFPTEHISHWDLKGKERTLTIKSVDLNGKRWIKGRRERAIVLYFEGAHKGLCVNAGIYATIAILLGYGDDVEAWVGRRITLYPATDDQIRGEDKRCVRVRPRVPVDAQKTKDEKPAGAEPQAETAPEGQAAHA